MVIKEKAKRLANDVLHTMPPLIKNTQLAYLPIHTFEIGDIKIRELWAEAFGYQRTYYNSDGSYKDERFLHLHFSHRLTIGIQQDQEFRESIMSMDWQSDQDYPITMLTLNRHYTFYRTNLVNTKLIIEFQLFPRETDNQYGKIEGHKGGGYL